MSSSTLFEKGEKVTIEPITEKTVYIMWNPNFEPWTPQYPEGMDPILGSNFFKVYDGTTMIREQIEGVIANNEKPGEKVIIKVNNIFVHIPSDLRGKIVRNMIGGRRKNRRGTKKVRRTRRRSSRRN
jgi:hypothetical protein